MWDDPKEQYRQEWGKWKTDIQDWGRRFFDYQQQLKAEEQARRLDPLKPKAHLMDPGPPPEAPKLPPLTAQEGKEHPVSLQPFQQPQLLPTLQTNRFNADGLKLNNDLHHGPPHGPHFDLIKDLRPDIGAVQKIRIDPVGKPLGGEIRIGNDTLPF